MKIKAKSAAKPATDASVATPAKAVKKVAKKAAKPSAKTQRVTFSVHAKPGSEVFLAGAFNDWNPSAKRMIDKQGDGLYAVTLTLAKGTYEYKFVIDGTWCADPECPDWVPNDHGTLNSVKNVE